MEHRSSSISKGRNKHSQNNNDQRLSKVRKTAKFEHSNRSHTKSIKELKQCSQNCKKHDFEMKPLGYSNYLSRGITQSTWVNFCCKGNSSTIPIPVISKSLMVEPQVPLFILNQEIYRYEHYMDTHRQQFQDAVTKAHKSTDDTKQDQIYVAIPKNKNCQVCRLKIETDQEYQRHIASNEHDHNLKVSLGEKYINEETEKFQTNHRYECQIQQKQLELKEVCQILKQAKKAIKNLLRKK